MIPVTETSAADSRAVIHLKRFLDDILLVLPPDMIIPPYLAVDGPYGLKRVELVPPSDPDSTPRRLKTIPAAIVIAEAQEAALMMFSSHSPVASFTDGGSSDEPTTLGVTIMQWTPEEKYSHVAPLILRKTQPPVVGVWSAEPSFAHFGPSFFAMDSGLDMVARLRLPENRPVRDRIDALRKLVVDEEIVDAVFAELCEVGWLPLEFVDDEDD